MIISFCIPVSFFPPNVFIIYFRTNGKSSVFFLFSIVTPFKTLQEAQDLVFSLLYQSATFLAMSSIAHMHRMDYNFYEVQ